MPLIQALMIALSGFIVVFMMLCILWGLISLVSRIVARLQPAEVPAMKLAEPEKRSQPKAEAKKPAEIYGGEIALYDVDEKTAACIMAIISDSTKIPLDHLIFKSIRALD